MFTFEKLGRTWRNSVETILLNKNQKRSNTVQLALFKSRVFNSKETTRSKVSRSRALLLFHHIIVFGFKSNSLDRRKLTLTFCCDLWLPAGDSVPR